MQPMKYIPVCSLDCFSQVLQFNIQSFQVLLGIHLLFPYIGPSSRRITIKFIHVEVLQNSSVTFFRPVMEDNVNLLNHSYLNNCK